MSVATIPGFTTSQLSSTMAGGAMLTFWIVIAVFLVAGLGFIIWFKTKYNIRVDVHEIMGGVSETGKSNPDYVKSRLRSFDDVAMVFKNEGGPRRMRLWKLKEEIEGPNSSYFVPYKGGRKLYASWDGYILQARDPDFEKVYQVTPSRFTSFASSLARAESKHFDKRQWVMQMAVLGGFFGTIAITFVVWMIYANKMGDLQSSTSALASAMSEMARAIQTMKIASGGVVMPPA